MLEDHPCRLYYTTYSIYAHLPSMWKAVFSGFHALCINYVTLFFTQCNYFLSSLCSNKKHSNQRQCSIQLAFRPVTVLFVGLILHVLFALPNALLSYGFSSKRFMHFFSSHLWGHWPKTTVVGCLDCVVQSLQSILH